VYYLELSYTIFLIIYVSVGGTADITAYEILKNGFFKQILHSTGNDCGGTSVDTEFFNILEDIIGTENMKKFRNENTIEYLEICSSFESVKRNITRQQTEMINIAIPIACLDELDPSENFDKMLQNSKYADKITVRKLKMRLDPELAKSLFSKTIEKLVSVITGILQRETVRSISVILLVGGFSESKLVQYDIVKAFPNKRIIIPKDPTVAVLKGAVLFGHRPDVVTTRVTTCSYGRKVKPIFNPRIHENRRMVKIDGEPPRCDGVFELLIKSGTSVPIGKTVCKTYHTVSRYQEDIRVALYRSFNDDTKYVDEEDCCLVGECIVPVLRPSDNRRNVKVQFEFGDTEIYITAVDKETHTTVKETFRLE
jgi:molecular chaperone DnaK (HSP70)